MFKPDAVIGEYFKNDLAEADLIVHHLFFDVDRGQPFFAGDTGYDMRRFFVRKRLDPGSPVIGRVGISDVYRNSRDTDGKDRILVKDGRSHVRKFAELAVSYRVDTERVFYTARICHEHSRNVCPVFVNIGAGGSCENGSRHVGAAAGKSFDLSVGRRAVEPRKNGAFVFRQSLCESDVCFFRVKETVFIEKDTLGGVDEIISEIFRHDFRVQIFAAGSEIIAGGCSVANFTLDQNEILIKRKIEFKPSYNVGKTRGDRGKQGFRVFARLLGARKCDQHIGDFFIVGMSFARGGSDRVSAAVLGFSVQRIFWMLLHGRFPRPFQTAVRSQGNCPRI